jgi:hypothetical protein
VIEGCKIESVVVDLTHVINFVQGAAIEPERVRNVTIALQSVLFVRAAKSKDSYFAAFVRPNQQKQKIRHLPRTHGAVEVDTSRVKAGNRPGAVSV